MTARLVALPIAVALAVGAAVTAEDVHATTVDVDCTADPAALGPALATAAPGDTIRISGTCRGSFSIDKSLTLEGRGQGATLHGDGAGPVLSLNFDPVLGPIQMPPPTIRLAGLTVTGAAGTAGNPWEGAAIASWATTELEGVTVRDNGGVGIWQFESTTLDLRRSLVAGNAGTGIAANHSVTLRSSTVRGNGSHGITGSCTGGITLFGSAVEDNAGRGIVGGCQTGIHLERSRVSGNRDGGIMATGNDALLVVDSVIVGNTTPDSGGGIYADSPILAGVQVTGSTIEDNTAGIHGGGIYVTVDPARGGAIVESTTIRGNAAGWSGGGIFQPATGELLVRRSTLARNVAGTGGGAIRNEGVLTLDGARFVRNTPDDCSGC